MASVQVTYKPEPGQSFRCSPNFSNWETSANDWLKFEVSGTPGGCPEPVYQIEHQKAPDDSWFGGLLNGSIIPATYQDNDTGSQSLYVGTTPAIDQSGCNNYTLTVYKTSLTPPPVTQVAAQYGPLSGQSFRSSENFPYWNVPDNYYLQVLVHTTYPGVPVLAIDYSKSFGDTRWYSGVRNGSIFSIDSENGESGSHDIYVGTVSPIPPGVSKDDEFTVTIKWFAEPPHEEAEATFQPPPGATSVGTLSVKYDTDDYSDYFSNWDVPSGATLYASITLDDGHTVMPSFNVHHKKSTSNPKWYTGITNGSIWQVDDQNGGTGSQSHIHVSTTSPLPPGVSKEDTYSLTIWYTT